MAPGFPRGADVEYRAGPAQLARVQRINFAGGETVGHQFPERPKGIEAGLERVAANGIEHSVDAPSVGQFPNHGCDIVAADHRHVVRTCRHSSLDLRLGAYSADHPHAQRPCPAGKNEADATRSSVDEDRLTSLGAMDMTQQHMRSHSLEKKRCGALIRNVIGKADCPGGAKVPLG